MPDLRSYLARSRDEWLESAPGKRCLNCNILRRGADDVQYLRNRLEAAFIAGYDAAKSERSADHASG